MNCIDEGTLQAWFDGELKDHAAANVAAHVKACVQCVEAARTIEAESLLLSEGLAAEFAAPIPSDRLRRQVELEIAGRHQKEANTRRSRWNPLTELFASFRPLVYASVAAMILLAAFVGFIYLKKPQPAPVAYSPPPSVTPDVIKEPGGTTPRPMPAPSPQYIAVQGSKRMRRSTAPEPDATSLSWQEQQYQYAIAKLGEAIKIQPPMRPALQVEYEYNLAVVDNEIAKGRNAAKKNPKDPQAAEFMRAAYQSKVDLMNQVADARVLEE